MPKRSRIQYWTLTSYGSNQKNKNRCSQRTKRKAAISRTHPTEPVTSIEHAMDIAMGAEGGIVGTKKNGLGMKPLDVG